VSVVSIQSTPLSVDPTRETPTPSRVKEERASEASQGAVDREERREERQERREERRGGV
jgi:hypothetical protein